MIVRLKDSTPEDGKQAIATGVLITVLVTLSDFYIYMRSTEWRLIFYPCAA